MRTFITRLASSDRVRRSVASSQPARELIERYVPAQTIEQVIAPLDDLRSKGLDISLEYQGIEPYDPHSAQVNFNEYLRLISYLKNADRAKKVEICIRPSFIGAEADIPLSILIDRTLEIVDFAQHSGCETIIDMGPSHLLETTLTIWTYLVKAYPRCAITIQSIMKRSVDDCLHVADNGARRVRVVKGVYREPRSIAWTKPHDIDLSYVSCARLLAERGVEVLYATHDPRLVAIAEAMIRSGRSHPNSEFQMMYGIRPLEQRRLCDIGFNSRVYIPFGPGWYSYYLRRMVERPSNVALFARSLIGKK